MSKITVTVPDGDKCGNCDYWVRSYSENAMRQGSYKYWCFLFKCEVNNDNKCMACKICAKED